MPPPPATSQLKINWLELARRAGGEGQRVDLGRGIARLAELAAAVHRYEHAQHQCTEDRAAHGRDAQAAPAQSPGPLATEGER